MKKMLKKISAGLVLTLFLTVTSGISLGLLQKTFAPQEKEGQVLGRRCLPDRARCRHHAQCCGGYCHKPPWGKRFPWYPGRCLSRRKPPKPRPTEPTEPRPTSKIPRPTRKPPRPQPTKKPPKPTFKCSYLRSIKSRIDWTVRSIDIYCRRYSKKQPYCIDLQPIKRSLQSLAQKVNKLYQKCQKRPPKPSITPYPTPNQEPTPTSVKKKCGLNTFMVLEPCAPGRFLKVQAVCYDGTRFDKREPCLSSIMWKMQAEEFCRNHCSSK